MMDFDAINRAALAQSESLLRGWFPAGRRAGHEFLLGDLAGNPGKSLAINLNTGVWCDFATGEKGKGLLALLSCKERIPVLEAAKRLQRETGAIPLPPVHQHKTPHHSRPKSILPVDFGPGSVSELNALRILRHLPSWSGAMLAEQRGVLGFGWARDGNIKVRVWCLTDAERRVAQWRRLDGALWEGLPSHPKARTAVARTGEGCWPAGLSDARHRELIVLCEGGPDLLAAYELLWLATSETPSERERIGIITLFGASHRIHTEALPYLKNKHIRIVYHDDEAGKRACVRLAQELLAAHAAKVDAFRVRGLTLSPEGKDLNDCIGPDLDATNLTKLYTLFSK